MQRANQGQPRAAHPTLGQAIGCQAPVELVPCRKQTVPCSLLSRTAAHPQQHYPFEPLTLIATAQHQGTQPSLLHSLSFAVRRSKHEVTHTCADACSCCPQA